MGLPLQPTLSGTGGKPSAPWYLDTGSYAGQDWKKYYTADPSAFTVKALKWSTNISKAKTQHDISPQDVVESALAAHMRAILLLVCSVLNIAKFGIDVHDVQHYPALIIDHAEVKGSQIPPLQPARLVSSMEHNETISARK